jgi:phosphate transport system ATP-binding protein
MSTPEIISIRKLNLHYGTFHALKEVNLSIGPRMITALIGPSGCGKSTLLRTLNRMNDLVPGCRITGRVEIDGSNIYDKGVDVCALRKRVGMVFQRPNPFPLSIRDNVTFGLRVAGVADGALSDGILEKSLRGAWLWDHVKDKLDSPALDLPLDQQQRLCVARVLAVEPEVILMDEPCSALDPISTAKIEELMLELRTTYTIVIVTHNMQQAARISARSAFMLLGEMIEEGDTLSLFTKPADRRTEDYITGRFG